MNITAIYPGTFDPITNGHSEIVLRASKLFSKVIVSVAQSTSKKTAFTTRERTAMAKIVLGHIKNVEVKNFSGLVTEFALSQKATVIVRGLRAVSDFEYEIQMAGMNRQLVEDIETLFLIPSEHLNFISSSLVREIASLGGDVSKFVHNDVRLALKKRFKN